MAIRLDKVKGTAHHINFTYSSDLVLGMFVAEGALKADGEGYVANAPADVTKDTIVLHVSPALNYNNELSQDFVLKAGKVGNGLVLEKGDIITLTDDLFTGTSAVGKFLIPANGAVKGAIATALTAEVVALKAIAKETLAGSPATVFEVVKA